MFTALLSFAGAGLVTLLLTPAAARLATRLGVVDRPGGYKRHRAITPLLGGVAIFAGLLAGAAVAAGAGALLERYSLAVLVGAAAVFALGLLDDWRGLGVGVRLTVQLAAAAVPVLVLVRQPASTLPWPLIPIALLWIAGVANAFNLLDNTDGASAGVGAVSALLLAGAAAAAGQPAAAASLPLALGGACLGFLRANFPPATVFMGSAGSLAIGFVLAAGALPLALRAPAGALAAVAIFFVPLLDTALVVVSRLRRGLDPLRTPGRDHIAHRLVRSGLSVRATVATLYAASAAVGALGLWLANAGGAGPAAVAAAAAALAALALAAIAGLERVAAGGGEG